MKQFFEVFLDVVLMLFIVFISAQGVMTNTQISAAKEYHQTCVERIENTGLSQEFIDELVDYTNNNTSSTGYKLTVEPVTDSNGGISYHVSLDYQIRSVAYALFNGSVNSQHAVIDGYASIGKNSPTTTSADVAKHGTIVKSNSIGDNATATLYEDGYLILAGDGEISDDPDDYINFSDDTTYLVIDGSFTELPDKIFSYFDTLKGINLGSVQSIGENTFANCTSLVTVSIPSSTTKISDYAFSGCSKLEYVYINNKNENVVFPENCFDNCPKFVSVIYLK